MIISALPDDLTKHTRPEGPVTSMRNRVSSLYPVRLLDGENAHTPHRRHHSCTRSSKTASAYTSSSRMRATRASPASSGYRLASSLKSARMGPPLVVHSSR